MELKEFIENTLLQIVDGVKSVQEKGLEKGAIISPSVIDKVAAGYRKVAIYENQMRIFTDVEFEVALTSSDGKEGKGGIGVYFAGIGIGGQEKTDIKNETITNIKFSIPVSLPAIITKTTSQ